MGKVGDKVAVVVLAVTAIIVVLVLQKTVIYLNLDEGKENLWKNKLNNIRVCMKY